MKTIQKGQLAVSTEASERLFAPSLGSTLAVIASDSTVPVAGMALLVLPGPAGSNSIAGGPELLKGLFHEMVKAGAGVKEMKVVLAGAAGFIREPEVLALGRELYKLVKKSLMKSGISISGEHVGGPINRSVSIEVGSGEVCVKMPDEREVIL